MPSASKQQQKLMGIVRAIQKGDMKPSQATGKAKEMAKSMKKGDVKDFAATKHKGLPKKVKKENMGVASMYVVQEARPDMKESDLVVEFNPLEGVGSLNINMNDVHSVHHDEKEARRIAAEAYKSCMDEAFQLEEKKGKVGDKLKKTIDHLEKKRKEHVDMAKEDPKNASKHKEHIAKLATQIDDLMSKMEKIEKSKKNVEKVEDKKEDIKESIIEGKNWSKMMAGVRKGSQSGPWTIVVSRNKKVVYQKQVKVKDAIPANFEDVKNTSALNGDIFAIEDNEGMIVYKEKIQK
jgi:hypothetical protein